MNIIDWDFTKYPIHDLTLTSNNPVYQNTSLNLKTTTRARNLNQIQLDFSLTVGGYDNIRSLHGWLTTVTNGKNLVRMRLGGIFSNPTITNVNTTVAKNTGADRISLNSNSIVGAGSYFNLANDTKLYQILSDIRVGEVAIWPPLRISLPNGSPLGFTNPYIVGEVTQTSYQTQQTEQGLIATVTLSIIEKL
ncbi:hypothetical protein [Shewanella sp. SE1]|uniref:hypothetical protein n=1 Tax=Shewanella sp. SE1 TaxID=2705014 RepID=UPI00138F4B74|nr:hypothetical protein [Shewanella sp. SE1]NDO73081.1 hypothetical protein [Shewanella sp. SE1]